MILGLVDKDQSEEVCRELDQANTLEQVRRVLVEEVLYNAMKENLDFFPNQLRIGPAEKFRGEVFL